MSAISHVTCIMLMTKAHEINHALDILRLLHMAKTIVSLFQRHQRTGLQLTR